ncbi:response regulator transcription factor [Streptomyces sp. NPDC004539]|uniref:response regulator transcription factor n=1 Tax=Streptomyces sp. NPDC004539 TaxID=3154280 RepID=UPI0033B275D3
MNHTKSATILVVDDHPIRTLGVVHVVEQLRYVATVNTSTTTGLYIAAAHSTPDVVLLGPASLPDGEQLTLVRLQQLTGGCRIITFGNSTNSRINPPNVSAGLCGFLPSRATSEDFDRAFSAALAGFTYFPHDVTEELVNYRVQFPQLTTREQEVLDLLSDGLSNRRIAKELGIKEATVKMYVTQVLAKLDVGSRLQACLKARGFSATSAA